jgi:drug/metabolite transporter (DMT)-like permease
MGSLGAEDYHSCLAYWLYLTGLRRVPASIAAASFYLIPIFGVAGGLLFLGERLEPSQWLGIALVASAIAVILGRTSGAELDELADGQRASGRAAVELGSLR